MQIYCQILLTVGLRCKVSEDSETVVTCAVGAADGFKVGWDCIRDLL